MTLTVENKNTDLPDNFLELQSKIFPLKPIHNKRDYTKAMKVAEIIGAKADLTKTQSDYLESLANNIEAYENQHWEVKKQSPLEVLKFLMDENGLNGSDLGRILGTRTLGSAILNGRRQLSKTHISKLADYFSVSPALFL